MRVCIYDATGEDFLGLSWHLGSWWAHRSDYFDVYFPAFDWYATLYWLQMLVERNDVREIQFWGHGLPGAAYIGRNALTHTDVERSKQLANMRGKLRRDCVLWFRTCLTFCDSWGHRFATAMANQIGCAVAGHTYKIGFPFHSGLHLLEPGDDPAWSIDEGVKERRGKASYRWSWSGQPNTILFCENDARRFQR